MGSDFRLIAEDPVTSVLARLHQRRASLNQFAGGLTRACPVKLFSMPPSCGSTDAVTPPWLEGQSRFWFGELPSDKSFPRCLAWLRYALLNLIDPRNFGLNTFLTYSSV